MYVQIIEQIRQRIAVGDWPAGSELPSIRQLAVDLRISVITVKRAYQELEQAGIIVTQQGKGSLVASTVNLERQLWEAELDQHLEQASYLGGLLGLTDTELIERLQQADHRRTHE